MIRPLTALTAFGQRLLARCEPPRNPMVEHSPRRIPGALLVTWRVIDQSTSGERTLAASEVIVAFTDAVSVRTRLLADLQRLFPERTATSTRRYQVDVQPA